MGYTKIYYNILFSIRQQINTLNDKLKQLKTTLDNHEPPRLLPDLIKEQLQELQVILY